MHPVVVSHITDPNYKKLPLKSLNYILNNGEHGFITTNEGNKIYRTRFCVEGFIPSDNVNNIVKINNFKKGESREAFKNG
jgi:hypothetical protein